jgi:hypothetical protein
VGNVGRGDHSSAGTGLWILPENKFSVSPGGSVWGGRESGFRSKIYSSDTVESLAQRGFRQSVFCKILLSKNLDLKILRTNVLAQHDLAAIDRHCLDYDRAIADWAKGQMSHCACGKLNEGRTLCKIVKDGRLSRKRKKSSVAGAILRNFTPAPPRANPPPD